LGDASGTRGINPADVRTALDTILQSETFARSERSRELLKYIVERDLEGQSDRLKGFAIALDVFDREDNFDPSTDAVVRVQAGRLRDLLETYYGGEGASAPVRITIPRGTYVPAYDLVAGPAALRTSPRAPPVRTRPGRSPCRRTARAATRGDHERMFFVNMRLFWMATAVVIAMLSGILGLMISLLADQARVVSDGQPAPAVARVQPLSTSEALPSIAIVNDTDVALRRALEDAIPRFGSVVYRNDRSSRSTSAGGFLYPDGACGREGSLNVQFFHRESGIMIGADHIPGGGTDAELADHVSRISAVSCRWAGRSTLSWNPTAGSIPLTKCLVLSSAYFGDQNAPNGIAPPTTATRTC
jgi:hypothetical protein